jgi:type I restriction-modification system DNA methylase subunit
LRSGLQWRNLLPLFRFADIYSVEFKKPYAKTSEPDIPDGLSVNDVSIYYEYSLAYVNYGGKKKNGQYFTPHGIASLMASYSRYFDNGI